MNRRNFIGSMLAAPAIVRAEILMPVTKIWTPHVRRYDGVIVTEIAAPSRELWPFEQWSPEQMVQFVNGGVYKLQINF